MVASETALPYDAGEVRYGSMNFLATMERTQSTILLGANCVEALSKMHITGTQIPGTTTHSGSDRLRS